MRSLRNKKLKANRTSETEEQRKESLRIRRDYIGYSLPGTAVSVATYPLTMRSIRGGTLGWNIEIYSTPTNQFD